MKTKPADLSGDSKPEKIGADEDADGAPDEKSEVKKNELEATTAVPQDNGGQGSSVDAHGRVKREGLLGEPDNPRQPDNPKRPKISFRNDKREPLEHKTSQNKIPRTSENSQYTSGASSSSSSP